MFAAGAVIAGKFRLIEPLGEGGMGAVWRAHHEGLDVPCAIKLIHTESADLPNMRARFEREAKAAAAMRSPHVVTVYDHGIWEDTPYMAMELLEGEDLRTRLDREGRIPVEELVSIIAQVARALTKAHAAGLVHRDLKPDNIFLARDDDREIAKVLDFGIAKMTSAKNEGSKTKTGSILGTPNYMSPEQAQGTKQVDSRSDLWSLAVVVFECIVGRPPFESEAFGDLLLQIMMHDLPVPSKLAEVPAGFDAWWERAAARDPSARFQSAKELAEELAPALGVSGPASRAPLGSQVDSRRGVAAVTAVPAQSSGGHIGHNTAANAPPVSLNGAPRSPTRRLGVFVGGATAGVVVCVGGLYALLVRAPSPSSAATREPAAAPAWASASARATAQPAPSAPPAAASAPVEVAPFAASSPLPAATADAAPAATTPAVPAPARGRAPVSPRAVPSSKPAPSAAPHAATAPPPDAPKVKKPTDYGF